MRLCATASRRVADAEGAYREAGRASVKRV